MGIARLELRFGPRRLAFWVAVFVTLCGAAPARAAADDLGTWLDAETKTAEKKLLAAILDNGAVIASPSKADPNYYYHWVRDGALATSVVVTLFERVPDQATRQTLFNTLGTCAAFSAKLQVTSNPSTPSGRGLGEPKWETSGAAFTDGWGRPQDDSPALRALTFIRLANILLDGGDPQTAALVKSTFYDAVLPTNSLIKRDLEYVSHNWQRTCFDLWEEVSGEHFYTRMAQRKALVAGAKLARRLNDPGAADWYEMQAASLAADLLRFWDPGKGYIVVTLNRDGGRDDRKQGLDAAVILGVLHSTPEPGQRFTATDDAVLATAANLTTTFGARYKINQVKADPDGRPLGVAIGRYPEDQYGGSDDAHPGNPWVLCTAAIGELYYRAANDWTRAGQITVTDPAKTFLLTVNTDAFKDIAPNTVLMSTDQMFKTVIAELQAAGDRQLGRIRYHANPDGSLNEQFNRDTGFMQSAVDLTWNYAGILTAAAHRRPPAAFPAVAALAPLAIPKSLLRTTTGRSALPPERLNRGGTLTPMAVKP
jgi:glucoamylase